MPAYLKFVFDAWGVMRPLGGPFLPPLVVGVQQAETAIEEDRRITVRQLVQDVKVSVGSVEKIIHDDLHM